MKDKKEAEIPQIKIINITQDRNVEYNFIITLCIIAVNKQNSDKLRIVLVIPCYACTKVYIFVEEFTVILIVLHGCTR